MTVTGLDGRDYKLTLRVADPDRQVSSGHERARALLSSLWPFDVVYEETFVPGCFTPLYLDFFLPRARLAVEVQGEQHRNFVPFFHAGRLAYLGQRRRDGRKREWAALNRVRLVELDDDADDGVWRAELLGSR